MKMEGGNVEIGAGIAVAGCGISIAAIIIKWISRGDTPKQCDLHAALAQQISSLCVWLEKIEKKLDRVIEGRLINHE